MTNLVKKLIMIVVKLFAILKDKAGRDELRIDAGPDTVAELLEIISKECPALKAVLSSGRMLVSVNQEFAKPDAAVKDGDEVALMPPFSGGSSRNKPQIRKLKSQINSKLQRSMFKTLDFWYFEFRYYLKFVIL